ncbi:alpha/beta fold hydrolase [Propionivibrio soli]|uniref:alpha/beta fold hydrolase n=1 Tax=Propionivibrio soli TaxID=2976531 RepID=UPI0021E72BFF|nr:alpha/beta hydrolase [Propionivibrio soli]
MKPSRTEFISVRGRRYHVRTWGDDNAPTLFFLHGWGDVGASFQFTMDEMQRDWRVIAPDWRGFGLTQWNDGAYWFADYIADLDILLERYSPGKAARIIGHSLGGIVAGLYAGIRPARVERLAMLEGFAPWIPVPGETPTRFEKWLQQIRDDNSAFRQYQRREEFAVRLCRDNPRLTPERAAFLSEHALLARDGGFVFAGDPRHRWINPVLYPLDEAKACWRRITAPTLWVAGRESPAMAQFVEHPEDYRERMACFAQVEEEVIDECGHNHHHDQPEALARLVEAFFP